MHNISELFFIKIFFLLLMVSIFLIAIVLATFNINDSVSFTRGEIMPEVPQQDYKAPFDGTPQTIFVKEGDQVKTGDTLIVLLNEQVRTDYEVARSNYEAALRANEAVSRLITITNDKIQTLQRERAINGRVHEDQKEKLSHSLSFTDQQAELNKEKYLNIGLSKLKMDSALYKNEMISKAEMNNSYDRYLNYRSTLLESENANKQIQSNLDALKNEYLKTENQLSLQLIEANEKLEELKIEKSKSDKELKTSLEKLKFSSETNNKQFIISGTDGVVTNLFNLQYNQNFVNKDALLLSIVPARDKFYVKVTIPQRDIRYIKVGQEAHLKFDAFDVYENGILKGTVSYVPEVPDRKQQEDFYVIIELLPNQPFELKAGYSVKGEIVMEQLKLYKFIAKKLFRRFTNNSTKIAQK